MMNDDPKTPTPVVRPSVLSLNIKEKAALYAAWMPYLKHGGIFVPTGRPYAMGDDVYLLLSLMEDRAKFPVAGKVVWITPQGAHNNKAQGIGVHFVDDEGGRVARARIEEILGPAIKSTRTTHTV